MSLDIGDTESVWDHLEQRTDHKAQRRKRAKEFSKKIRRNNAAMNSNSDDSSTPVAPPISDDPYGITRVFASHLAMSLDHMHPVRAFEAAQHATREYLASYDFKDFSSKESDAVQYRMFPKRSK